MLDGEALDRCPRRPFFDDPKWFSELYHIHGWLEKGFLPDGGTWRDQGAKIPVFMATIDMAVRDGQALLDKRQKAKTERAGPRGAPGDPRRGGL